MSKFVPLDKTDEQIRQIVLTNVIKMLVERKAFSNDDIDKITKRVLSISSDDHVYEIGSGVNRANNKVTYVCKIIPYALTAVAKSYGLTEFIEGNKSVHKIIIVKDINSKVLSHALTTGNDLVEVFLEKTLMIDLASHVLVPKHVILSNAEVTELLESYIVTKSNMPKILISDPIAKYYNMKVGDICKIIRASDKSGFVPYYRYVVKN